ncbi:MAG: sortase B protein-sorting domain-containing protein [Methanotrichaceae archaeon]
MGSFSSLSSLAGFIIFLYSSIIDMASFIILAYKCTR